jgi:hypothetical protein
MKRYSLHIGLNSVDPAHYGGWDGQLVACQQDAISMYDVCQNAGFDDSGLMLTEQATFSNVKTAMRAISDKAEPGDLVVITLSGHGGQIQDESSDEPDRIDETLCLFDAQVTDDVVFELLQPFKQGVRIVTIFDTCHSGSNVRRMPKGKPLPLIKSAPREVSQVATTFRAIKKPKLSAHLLHLGACQDEQLAYDGEVNGLFTGALLRSVEDWKGRVSWIDLMNRARAYAKPLQTPKGPTQYGRILKHYKYQIAFQ